VKEEVSTGALPVCLSELGKEGSERGKGRGRKERRDEAHHPPSPCGESPAFGPSTHLRVIAA
jgi:hypothetical protein